MPSLEEIRASQNQDQQAEVAALRARVAELENQLVEVEAWANRTVGAAQERLYWLDRWQLDLNAVMERPAAGKVRAVIRAMRSVYRFVLGLKRRLRGA